MLDLMEMGNRLWESGIAENAESQQSRGLQQEKSLRKSCGNLQCVCENPQNPQKIRSPENTYNLHGTGFSAKSAESAAVIPAENDTPAPLAEIDAIIDALADQVGRDLGAELVRAMRQALAPMDRKARADLAAAIDDGFEDAETAQEGRQKALALLGMDNSESPSDDAQERLGGLTGWVDWIAEQRPLLTDDRAFVAGHLARLPIRQQETATRRYVAAWQQATGAEARLSRRDNAGRFAANQTLLSTVERTIPGQGTTPPQRGNVATLAQGLIAWRVHVDGKAVTMLASCRTREEALAAARARWPSSNVEMGQ